MKNKKTPDELKNIIDLEAVHFMLFFFTVIFASIGMLVDLITDQKFQLWWIVLSSSFALFILTFVAKFAPKISFLIMLTSITVIGYYSYINIILDYKILVPQLVMLVIYFLVILAVIFINYFVIKNHYRITIHDKVLVAKKISGSRSSRKERKFKRRSNSRSKLGNAIKSGKYRGWWTGY